MSALARLRVLPRAHRAPTRSFHSPFVVLNASNPLVTPSSSTATPVYEKQEHTSSEPHLSSSGTRTYVVSEPDPSNTPYEVPSGAYPASTPYVSHGSPGTSHPYTGGAASAVVRSVETTGEMGKARGGSHKEIDPGAHSKSGKL